jgi:putative transposase
MAYVKNWLHCVWGTKNKTPYFTGSIKNEVIAHIRKNSIEKGIYIDFINGHSDHMHCLISLNPDQTLSKVMQLIKGESSFWINRNNITLLKFEWADEYYGISISESQLSKVRDYIKNQEEHHRIKTWAEECDEFIKKYGFNQNQG